MKHSYLFTASLLALSLSSVQSASADEIGLDFNLPAVQTTATQSQPVADQPTGQPTGVDELAMSVTTAQDLNFQPSPIAVAPVKTPVKSPDAQSPSANDALVQPSKLFEGGTESLVAKAVGSAEGTRTPEGHKTPAYSGHVDPGNGVWNLGSFSYQHGANSPQEADEKQLKRLQAQAKVLRRKAEAKGMSLSLQEELNGIDLANQAPMAALARGGYVDWLEQAHKMGLKGSEAVIWARTRSFLNPDTGRWNAPGLGNNVHSISHDQERRFLAIARALEIHQQNTASDQQPEPLQALAPLPVPQAPADQLIFQDLTDKDKVASPPPPKELEPPSVTPAEAASPPTTLLPNRLPTRSSSITQPLQIRSDLRTASTKKLIPPSPESLNFQELPEDLPQSKSESAKTTTAKKTQAQEHNADQIIFQDLSN